MSEHVEQKSFISTDQLSREVLRVKGGLVLAVHPTWAPRSNSLTRRYYEELDTVKSSGYPMLIMYETGLISDTSPEFRNVDPVRLFFMETVSEANAKPLEGWNILAQQLKDSGVTDLFLSGMNINFWVNVGDEIQRRPGAIEFNRRYRDILRKLGARDDVLPVQCLGSLMLELTTRVPEITLHFTGALYPAYFVPIGSRDKSSYQADLSAIPDLPQLL